MKSAWSGGNTHPSVGQAAVRRNVCALAPPAKRRPAMRAAAMMSRNLGALMWGTSHVELNWGYILQIDGWVSDEVSQLGWRSSQQGQHVLRDLLACGWPTAPNLISRPLTTRLRRRTAGMCTIHRAGTSVQPKGLLVCLPTSSLDVVVGPIVSYQIPLDYSD